MKNFLIYALILIIVAFGFFYFGQQQSKTSIVEQNDQLTVERNNEQEIVKPTIEEENTQLANPASVYCKENGGQLEIITENNGSQFGLCKLDDYACEEWAFYNDKCDIETDSVLIAEALKAKGLSLEGMKVMIKTHLSDEIAGSVVPLTESAGGGYVYAKKINGEMKIIADGNGSIMCSMLADYPDFSTFLIPQCVDDKTMKEIVR